MTMKIEAQILKLQEIALNMPGAHEYSDPDKLRAMHLDLIETQIAVLKIQAELGGEEPESEKDLDEK